MAHPEKIALKPETAWKNSRQGWFRASHFPVLAGSALPSAAILWAHAENYAENPQSYFLQPPTVSRALTNPDVAGPFAIAMIIGAALLLTAVWQIAFAMVRLLRDEDADGLSWLLLGICIVAEIPAIAGMVVLSQFTGDALSAEHNLGSYMLFFGHAFAICSAGWLISRLKGASGAEADVRLLALAGLPRHALLCALLAAVFGFVYFCLRAWPDASPFWMHLALTISEMLVLLAFLSFLGRFWRLLDAQQRRIRSG